MALTDGTEFLLKINTGTVGTPVYTLIGACTTHSMTQSYGTVDVSNKDSVWTTSLDGAGKKSSSVEFSGFVSVNGDDTGFEELKELADSATESQRLFEIILGDGEKITATLELTSFAITGADAQGTTYTASLISSGALTRASV